MWAKPMFRAVLCISFLCLFFSSTTLAAPVEVGGASTEKSKPVVLVKIGGSSITHKAVKETLNESALQWFVETIREASNKHAYVIVHGAGSFGHHTAKQFGLQGQTDAPPTAQQTGLVNEDGNSNNQQQKQQDHQLMMKGLTQTRVSVQKLNQALVAAFVDAGLNAVGISPCFGVPGIQAHGGDEAAQRQLQQSVHAAVAADLVPILHGDACLYGERGAGILSGDVVMELLGSADWVSHVVFLTDVNGVFTSDPNTDPENAVLIRTLTVNPATTEIVSASFGDEDADATDNDSIKITGSTHEHDVTGGLQTKLQSAATLAATGKAVTIVRCGSSSAEQALRMQEPSLATVLTPRWRLVPAANTTCETTDPSSYRIDYEK